MNGAINLLRFLAACIIVFHHFEPRPHNFIIGGYLCVEFFFVLSGFLLGKTVTHTQKTDTMVGGMAMLGKKILRLYPMYFIALIIYFIIFKHDYRNTNLNFFLSLFFIQNLADNVSWNYPDWYVSILFWSSIFLSMLSISEQYRKIIYALPLVYLGLYYFDKNSLNMATQSVFYLNIGFLRGLAGMSLGYITFAVSSRRLTSQEHQIFYTFLEIGSFVGLFYLLISGKNPFFTPLIACVLVSLFFHKKGNLSKMLDKKICVSLGNLSYVIYLFHTLLNTQYPKFMNIFGTATPFAIVTTTVFLSVPLRLFIEKPITAFIKKQLSVK